MRQGRKISGGKYHKARKKRLHELDRQPRIVKLGKEKRKKIKGRGKKVKIVLLSTDTANLYNPKTKKTSKTKIKTVVETPSDKFLARQNILIKSAIIETELGRAKITNRPSQEGMINATLVKE